MSDRLSTDHHKTISAGIICIVDVESLRDPETLRLSLPDGHAKITIPRAAIKELHRLGDVHSGARVQSVVSVVFSDDYEYLRPILAAAVARRQARVNPNSARARQRVPRSSKSPSHAIAVVDSCVDQSFQGYAQAVRRGSAVRILQRVKDPTSPTTVVICVPQLGGPVPIDETSRFVSFNSDRDQELLIQCRPKPYFGNVWVAEHVVPPEGGSGGTAVTRWVFEPADVLIEESVVQQPPLTPAEVRLVRLRCEQQTEGGDDEIYITVTGQQGGTAFDYRIPPTGGWNLRDDRAPREIRNILLWHGLLAPGDHVDLALVSIKEEDWGDGTDEIPGAIRCIVRNTNGTISISGSPAFANTTGGACAVLDGISVQRFDLRNEDGHYVLDILAPGTC